MSFNLEKLRNIAKPESGADLKGFKRRQRDGEWLKKSALIAISVEKLLRVKGYNKQDLASMLGVTPSQVTKLLSGKSNMSLKTICRIEDVIGEELINIPNLHNSYTMQICVPDLCEGNPKLPFEKQETGTKGNATTLAWVNFGTAI